MKTQAADCLAALGAQFLWLLDELLEVRADARLVDRTVKVALAIKKSTSPQLHASMLRDDWARCAGGRYSTRIDKYRLIWDVVEGEPVFRRLGRRAVVYGRSKSNHDALRNRKSSCRTQNTHHNLH